MTKRGAIIAVQTSRGGMIALQLLCVFILISLLSSPSLAKGGGMNLHNTYDPQHITSLPLEVQKAIMRRCSSPRALHTFATYPENTQRIVLHFERFFCNEPDGFCKTTGECLHQVYVSKRGHYSLERSYYAPPGD